MEEELRSNRALLDDMNEQAVKALLHTFQNDALKELYDNEIIAGKLYVLLNEEIND